MGMKTTSFVRWLQQERNAERISQRLLFALVGVVVVVFACFFLIGFDLPFEEDATFQAPLFTDVVMWLMYFLLLLSIGVVGFSAIHHVRLSNKGGKVVNNIPLGRISAFTMALLFVSLAVTFLFASSEPLKINGKLYDDSFWLKTSEMLIDTSLVLLFVALAGVVCGLSGVARKLKR